MATEAKHPKNELRGLIKRKISGLSETNVLAQSRKAQDLILSSPEYTQAKRIGIYLSMPKNEAQTDSLVFHALWSSKEVFVPYIYSVATTEKPKRKVMDMLQLSNLVEYGELEKDAWGIPTLPKEGSEERRNAMGGQGLSMTNSDTSLHDAGDDSGGLDVIIVPGVAFDREMNRTGHGAGFYDSFLTRFCEHGKRKKPYLGESDIACCSRITFDIFHSRSVSGGADCAQRNARDGELGLEGGCNRSRRWQLADLRQDSMSFNFGVESQLEGDSHFCQVSPCGRDDLKCLSQGKLFSRPVPFCPCPCPLLELPCTCMRQSPRGARSGLRYPHRPSRKFSDDTPRAYVKL